jgi:hypothetical protein
MRRSIDYKMLMPFVREGLGLSDAHASFNIVLIASSLIGEQAADIAGHYMTSTSQYTTCCITTYCIINKD